MNGLGVWAGLDFDRTTSVPAPEVKLLSNNKTGIDWSRKSDQKAARVQWYQMNREKILRKGREERAAARLVREGESAGARTSG